MAEKDNLNLEDCMGEIRLNNNGTPMMIVGGKNKRDVEVQFLDEFGLIKKHVNYNMFKNGSLKNPYDRTICGVGYIGKGKYRTDSPVFSVWSQIIARTFDEKLRATGKNASYYNATVCEDWLNYQKFAKWYEEHIYTIEGERIAIDKDIKYKGNKRYSPECCIMVPQTINSLFVVKPIKENGLPEGVNFNEDGRYKVTYRGKKVGIANTIDEACVLHDKAKKDYITKLTKKKYKGKIPQEVYDIIMNWIPDYPQNGVYHIDGLKWERHYR